MQLKKKTFTGTTSNEVTARETENRKIARQAAAEGFVLLKNEDHILPIKNGANFGLYGAGAVKTIKAAQAPAMSMKENELHICQGLKNAGYEITSDAWLEAYASCEKNGLNGGMRYWENCRYITTIFLRHILQPRFSCPAEIPLMWKRLLWMVQIQPFMY